MVKEPERNPITMRLPALLLLTLLCTCVRAQITPARETLKTRIDTVDGPIEGYRQVRFVTVMPAKVSPLTSPSAVKAVLTGGIIVPATLLRSPG